MSSRSSQHGKADRPCHECGGEVVISVARGNGDGEYADLEAACLNPKCGMREECLGGTMGRVDTARKEYRDIYELLARG